jgi:ferritin
MEDALNSQFNKELFSAYLYMAMSSYANKIGFKGFANWFMVQYHEEMFHAMKLYDYMQRQDGNVVFLPLEKPENEWKSLLHAFESTLEHEKYITDSINDLMDIAIKEKDHASQIFIQWYVTEQVEELESDRDIISQLKIIDNNPQGLLMLDKDLAQRVVTVTTDFSKGINVPPSVTA